MTNMERKIPINLERLIKAVESILFKEYKERFHMGAKEKDEKTKEEQEQEQNEKQKHD